MNTNSVKTQPAVLERPPRADLDKKILCGKAVLRESKNTLEDLEDRYELATAKERNAGKFGTFLNEAAKELGL